MSHPLAEQAAARVAAQQRLAPIGSPPQTTVLPEATVSAAPVAGVAPNPAAWPSADGSAVGNSAAPSRPAYVEAPASIQEQIEAANAATPQSVGEGVNQQILERMMAESEQRSAALAAQIAQQNEALTQHVQQTADAQAQAAQIAQQQLELQRQQAAAATQAQQLTPEERYALSEEERATYGTALPVIDKRTQMHIEQALSQMNTEDPRVAQLQAQLEEIQNKVGGLETFTEESFQSGVTAAAVQHGVDINALKADPAWNAFLAERPSPVDDTTYSHIVNAALGGKSAADVTRLGRVFAEFKSRQAEAQGQLNPNNAGNAVPAGGGQTRNQIDANPQYNPQAALAEIQQIQAREATLRHHLRRQIPMPDGTVLDPATFMKEQGLLNERMRVLQSQLPQG